MGHRAKGALTTYILYPVPFSAPSRSYGSDLGRECQARSVRPLACLGYCVQQYGTILLF